MALDAVNQALDPVSTYIYRKVAEQPWYKANSNTITATVSFILTMITTFGAGIFGADYRYQIAILVIGFFASCVGVKFTKNGWSKSQVKKLDEATAAYVDSVPLIPKEVRDFSAELDKLVAEFNSIRE